MMYLMTENGDKNHLDCVTRERLHDAHSEIHWGKLFKGSWFFIGMLVGYALGAA